MSQEMRALARRIKGIEQDVRGLAAGPQLAYSSIEDGAINEYDVAGTLKSTTGKQYDGTSTSASFNGPVPPTPTPAILAPVPGGLIVGWDGSFAAGLTTVAPMDFARVEVHVSAAPFDPLVNPHLLATFETPRGATVLISLPVVSQYVSLVTVSLSGKFSAGSMQVNATPLALVDIAAIDAKLAPLAGLPAQMDANNAAVTTAQADIAALGTSVTTVASDADAATIAAIATAAADATTKADAAQAAAITAAATTAQAKADAAQAAATTAAATYADLQASGASASAIAAAAADATAKANTAKIDATAAAALTAQAKADAAQAAAIAAAATTAQAKADAAQAAAIAAAAMTAQTKADAAQAAAIAAAATTAQAKANAAAAAAQAAAIAAAAADATAKANGAQSAATTAAATTAQAKADAAQAAAIAAAATTAQAKADAAQAAAIAAAAVTAQAKADAAQAAAITAAATDATAKANAALAAANVAMTSAVGGKNKVIFSTSVALGTAYTAGDVWFQKSGTLIIAQWEFVTGAWAPRTLDHAVISSIDAATITVGTLLASVVGTDLIVARMIKAGEIVAGKLGVDSVVAANVKAGEIVAGKLAVDSVAAANIQALAITAGKVAANVITATELSATAIDGRIITGSTIRTAAAGARFEVDSAGARLYDNAGNVEVNLPTDPTVPASFAGTVIATGLTVQDHLSVQGVSNELATQSVTTLQAGLMPPPSAPALVFDYPQVWMNDTNDKLGASSRCVGAWVTPGGGGFSRGWVHTDINGTIQLNIERFDTAGNLLSTGPNMGWSYSSAGNVLGVCECGTNITVLSLSGGQQSGNTIYSLENFDTISGAHGSSYMGYTTAGGYQATLFSDASWVYRAFMTATQVIIERLTPDSLVVTGTFSGPNAGVARNLTSGMGISNFDFGIPGFLLTTDAIGSWAYFFSQSGSTLTLQQNNKWPLPVGYVPYGVIWDGVRFWVGPALLDNTMIQMSLINWTTESATWWASYSWYQTSTAHQTPPSPSVRFTMAKRGWIFLTTPVLPVAVAQPDSVMIYMGRGAADPGNYGMWHQAGDAPVAGRRTSIYGATAYAFSGSTPPTVTSFPSGVPGKIVSSALRADGVTPKWTIDGAGGLSGANPIGAIIMYGAYAAPANWLRCDGTSLLRSDHLDLFGVIGTSFGSVDSTHFTLPDFTTPQAFPISVGPANGLGSRGGEATHVLTMNEMPLHNHRPVAVNGAAVQWVQYAAPAASSTSNRFMMAIGTDTVIPTAQGGGAAANNMPPFVGVNFIIRDY